MRIFSRHTLIQLTTALSVLLLGIQFFYNTTYDVYPVDRLVMIPLLLLPGFLLVSFISSHLIFPAWAKQTMPRRRTILLSAAGLLLVALCLFPPPEPDFNQSHHLVIKATGQKSISSTGSVVQIDELRYLNRTPMPEEVISGSTDWHLQGSSLTSQGGDDSRIEVETEMPVGMLIYFHYRPDGGKAILTWDGSTQTVNLYARESAVLPLALRGQGIFALPAGQMLLALLATLGYCIGILVLLLAGLTLLFHVAGQRAESLAYWGVMAVLTALFLYLKLLYLRYDAPHAMGDSFSYVFTGEYPLTSMQFWAGLRPFTIPLAAKLLGINTQNYLMNEQLGRFAYLQTLFSAFAWTVFAFTCARITRSRSVSLVLFGIILSFSLSLQVSLWDALLLSESLSFSLLALMLAGWLYMLMGLQTVRAVWIRWTIVVLTILATILYAFGRDSNVYYVLAATAVILFFWLSDRKLQPYKNYILIYTGAVLLIFVGQFISLSSGNRWQVFMYDQLGMRILLDPQATQFFEAEGLPLNDTLMTIPSMRGSKYQVLINTSPDLKLVKSWVNCCSKKAYLQYLLSNPLRTLSEPLMHWPSLVNGSLAGYRNPRNGIIPLPRLLDNLSQFYFSREQWTVVVFVLLVAVGLGMHLFRLDSGLWIWIAAIAIPTIPMIYLIWFGEPMEIDRHAAQISLQLHLAAWISIPLLAEKAIQWIARRSFWPTRSE